MQEKRNFARFPPSRSAPAKLQGPRSPPPARPFPTSGHKEEASGRLPGGRGQVWARAGRRRSPGSFRAPRPDSCTYQEKQQRALRAPRHRLRLRLRLGPLALLAACVPVSAHPLLPGAPAPRVPSPAAAARPAQRRGSRCGRREKMEPGARPNCLCRGWGPRLGGRLTVDSHPLPHTHLEP